MKLHHIHTWILRKPLMTSLTDSSMNAHECTIQNQQTPRQNQQNPPFKIKSGKANQEKTNNTNKHRNNQTPLKLKLKTKQSNNVNGKNQEQQQQKRSTKQQQQQSKLEQNQDGGDSAEMAYAILRNHEIAKSRNSEISN